MANLTKIIDKGKIDLRKELLKPNKFTNDDIDKAIQYLDKKQQAYVRKQNASVLDTQNQSNETFDNTFVEMKEMLSTYKNTNIIAGPMQTDTHKLMQSYLVGGKNKSKKQRHFGKKKTAKKRSKRNTIKRRKMKRTRKIKGGSGGSVCETDKRDNCDCEERFIKLKEDGNDENCTICQSSLKDKIDIDDEEHRVRGSIIYQIGCGNRFHSYCLHTYCDTDANVKNLVNNTNLLCPAGCGRACINQDTAMTLDAFAGHAEKMALEDGELYLTSKYTGVPTKKNWFSIFRNR
jgi:hypothetical protein|uniref:Uncharacterized protein n=1 Tax=viral metagenome TaxID=1070528 RepID=A0A6C0INA0_9ZZZZ